jgi:hypothetical protein
LKKFDVFDLSQILKNSKLLWLLEAVRKAPWKEAAVKKACPACSTMSLKRVGAVISSRRWFQSSTEEKLAIFKKLVY